MTLEGINTTGCCPVPQKDSQHCSPSRCHLALSKILHDLIWVEKSPLYHPHIWCNPSWCGWLGYVLNTPANVPSCSCFYYWRFNTGFKNRGSHTGICPKHLKILSFPSQYILSLLLFLVNNKNKFKLNSCICNINTGYKYNFHHFSWNLSLYQKGVYLIAVKVFTTLPQNIKNFSDYSKQFNSALKII